MKEVAVVGFLQCFLSRSRRVYKAHFQPSCILAGLMPATVIRVTPLETGHTEEGNGKVVVQQQRSSPVCLFNKGSSQVACFWFVDADMAKNHISAKCKGRKVALHLQRHI
jgi:hypothetical protein